MFKKESDTQDSTSQPRPAQSASGLKPQAPRKGGAPAVIGPSITIKGDVTGDEDLMIQGRVEGSVNLTQHNVTIGNSGRVKAGVHGRLVVVEGEVEGDLLATEQIILRNTAKVEGSLSAPRVALEDGAVFRGGIEMDSTRKAAPPKNAQPTSTKPGEKSGDHQVKATNSRGEKSSRGLSA